MKPYYQDDAVTIYHGDTLEVLPALGTFDACVTDPPYIIGAVSAHKMDAKSGGWADMMNSAIWFTTWYRLVDEHLLYSAPFWSFCNWRSLPVVMRAAIDARMPLTSLAVWDKEWIGASGATGLRSSYEMIALFCRGEFAIADRGVPDVFRCKVGSYKPHGHPAEKPENILAKVLTVSELPAGAVVLDPFLGSGTTAKVAKDLGLRCVGLEAEERYCEIAARRVSQEVLAL